MHELIKSWRGFNLLEKFTHRPDEWLHLAPEWGFKNEPFREQDFEMIAELGFNFVRLPMSYKCWTEEGDWYAIKERHLKEIDEAIDFGQRYGVHVCINFHRAPGYTINNVDYNEQKSLWHDDDALDACAFHWRMFAERYKGVLPEYLSFNLLNEPNNVTLSQHSRVIRRLVADIRAIDSDRLLIIDSCKNRGVFEPSFDLIDLNVVQSARGYDPAELTHYKASWADDFEKWEKPKWPLRINGEEWDQSKIRERLLTFRDLTQKGNAVFVGEFGCYNKTPHEVALSWMSDLLTLFRNERWGWALWCFRGSFGILDSGRKDVKYEKYRGHLLDREMLEILQNS